MMPGLRLGNWTLGFAFLTLLTLFPILYALSPALSQEYKFEASEVEKKPYHIGGYVEAMPILFGIDRNSAMYKLNFLNRSVGAITPEYDGTLQLEGSFEKGIAKFYLKTNTGYTNNYAIESTKTIIFEGNVSLKPSAGLIAEFGKKTLNWGKGYAWNPAAFLDRPKNPDDPELAREGYIVASLDFTRSWEGHPLKTFTFTPVLVPSYSGVNDDFGETGHLNGASKFYFLLYDTDIDLIFLTGGSKTTQYGADFSRNITTNLEVHGEFSLIDGFQKNYVGADGTSQRSTFGAKSYLLGLRYLSARDTTYIMEYYRNGTGFSPKEMRDFFTFVDSSYAAYTAKGSTGGLGKAVSLFQGPYGKPNPEENYIYLRISQKEPFDILYFTPAITWIANIDDKSFSLAPEITYTGFTNWELRLRSILIAGQKGTEFGEKQNDYRVDLRVRYYF
jgi:hypothetical protein